MQIKSESIRILFDFEPSNFSRISLLDPDESRPKKTAENSRVKGIQFFYFCRLVSLLLFIVASNAFHIMISIYSDCFLKISFFVFTKSFICIDSTLSHSNSIRNRVEKYNFNALFFKKT